MPLFWIVAIEICVLVIAPVMEAWTRRHCPKCPPVFFKYIAAVQMYIHELLLLSAVDWDKWRYEGPPETALQASGEGMS